MCMEDQETGNETVGMKGEGMCTGRQVMSVVELSEDEDT